MFVAIIVELAKPIHGGHSVYTGATREQAKQNARNGYFESNKESFTQAELEEMWQSILNSEEYGLVVAELPIHGV